MGSHEKKLLIGELPAISVGKFLLRKGLILSDIVGNKLRRVYPEMWGIGILEDHPYWPPEKRYQLAAIIDFYSYNLETMSGQWILLVFGTSRLWEFKKLAEEMRELFRVDIKCLISCTDDELVGLGCNMIMTAG